MSKWKKLVTVPISELDAILTFTHPSHQQNFLKTNWRPSSRGFRLLKNVIRTDNCKRLNPRISGKISFEKGPNKKGEILATEVKECSHQFCREEECRVKLRLQYLADNCVKISYSSANHGGNYKPDISQLNISHKVRNKIIENDNGGRGTTAGVEFLRISIINEENKVNPENSAVLPSKKQIENLLHYERGKDPTAKIKNEQLNLTRPV